MINFCFHFFVHFSLPHQLANQCTARRLLVQRARPRGRRPRQARAGEGFAAGLRARRDPPPPRAPTSRPRLVPRPAPWPRLSGGRWRFPSLPPLTTPNHTPPPPHSCSPLSGWPASAPAAVGRARRLCQRGGGPDQPPPAAAVAPPANRSECRWACRVLLLLAFKKDRPW